MSGAPAAPAAVPAADRSRLVRRLHRLEETVIVAILAAMVVLPVVEVVSRSVAALRGRIPSTILTVQQLTLWLGLIGAGLAAREGRHLSMAPIAERLTGWKLAVARVVAAIAAGTSSALFAVASVELVGSLRGFPPIGGIPEWIWALALPIGFAIVAVRLGVTQLAGGWKPRLCSLLPLLAAIGFLFLGEGQRVAVASALVWPVILFLVGATVLGAPLYALLGGVPLVLFLAAGEPLAAFPNATYGLSQSPMYATIPLFTLAGYVLAEGGASGRLVRLFRALFGWMPGGLAVAAACVCAFFTTFTGGSGVTILALGGLLLPAMLEAGYRDRYSVGLLTTSGSLGLLFPPSVPVILYGVIAAVPIERLFAGALVPGVLLLMAVAATGLFAGAGSRAGRARFAWREAGSALWAAKWEALLPVVVLTGLFGGYTTPLEAAAMTALYAILVETVALRELSARASLAVLTKTGTLMGGVMMIIGVSLALTSYLVDADVPFMAAEWVGDHIHSRFVFLLALNVFLLLVGCLMDIFSAIVVVVPLVTPMAEVFGVDPVHLGVIFVANLELGYLTPPVGLNLFLASFRFERPLLQIYRSTWLFFLILLAVVVAITYVPWLTEVGLGLLGPR